MRFAAILFDFDGVLIESEAEGNRHLADYLSRIGRPIDAAEAMARFMGLAGRDFLDRVESWLGRPLSADFHSDRAAEAERAMADGIDPVAGAIAFVRSLPAGLPIAVTSSSSTAWIAAHLDHLGLADRFDGRLFSGREHVARGKPAPDLYLHAAAALGIAIEQCLILEDSPVGAAGAVASGATVIGLCAASHCGPDHESVLRDLGVQYIAHDFADVAALLGESISG
jgi:HAD superfamily hydrolase (TIGR01509 family)